MLFTKLRKTLIFLLPIFICICSFKYIPINEEINTINEEITEEITQNILKNVDDLIKVQLNDENGTITDLLNNVHNKNNLNLASSSGDDLEDYGVDEVSSPEQIIHHTFECLSDDAKEEFATLAADNVDIDYIYRLCSNQEYVINLNDALLAEFNEFASVNVKSKYLKSIAAVSGISYSLLYTITCCLEGATAASFIWFVGWAIAAVLVIAIVVIVVSNWDQIKSCFAELKQYLINKYSRISSLVSTTLTTAEQEAKQKAIFTINPYDFNPKGLYRSYDNYGNNGLHIYIGEGQIIILFLNGMSLLINGHMNLTII